MLCLVLLTVLAGCAPEAPATVPITVPPTTMQPVNAREIYSAACAEADAAKNLLLSYSRSESRTVSQDTYDRLVTGSASYSGIGEAK
jgi:hypothetical protein